MPGLADLRSNIAGAVVQAWDIPGDSTSSAWVVGLADGQSPEILQQLGFETAVQTPYLPNTFVLEFAEPQRGRVPGADLRTEFGRVLLSADRRATVLAVDPELTACSGTSGTCATRARAVPGQPAGTAGQDVNIATAWDTYKGSGVVIGIVDDGVQYTHYDLAPNIWMNPGEIAGNGIDDDGNGFVDDVRGYDFNGGDADPAPVGAQSHGTQMAGIVSCARAMASSCRIVGTAHERETGQPCG